MVVATVSFYANSYFESLPTVSSAFRVGSFLLENKECFMKTGSKSVWEKYTFSGVVLSGVIEIQKPLTCQKLKRDSTRYKV